MKNIIVDEDGEITSMLHNIKALTSCYSFGARMDLEFIERRSVDGFSGVERVNRVLNV